MPIARDATSALGSSNATAVNASLTVGSLTNGYLLVGLVYQDTTSAPSSVTWNTSQSMSLLAGPYSIAGTTVFTERLFIYGLANPASGTHNITCNKAADGVFVTFWGQSYSGVGQIGQPDSIGQNAASPTTSLTVSTTVVANNSWIFGCFRRGGSSPSAGANTSILGDDGAGSITDSNGAQAPGSRSQTFNQTNAGIGGLIISFSPPATPVVGSGSFLLNLI